MIEVSVQNVCAAAPVPSFELLKQWVQQTLSKVGYAQSAEMTIRIVDKVESQSLNLAYRKKDQPTNVLSFYYDDAGSEQYPGQPQLLGDLVVCAEIVKNEADTQRKSPVAHWAHMITHGTLHLLGYDHIIEDEQQKMENIEIDILDTLGFGNPYIADAN